MAYRVPVDNIRIASRASQGVRVFRTAESESVISAERISEPEDDEDAGETPPSGVDDSSSAESDGSES